MSHFLPPVPRRSIFEVQEDGFFGLASSDPDRLDLFLDRRPNDEERALDLLDLLSLRRR